MAATRRSVSFSRGPSKPEWIDAITQSRPASDSSSMSRLPSARMSTSIPARTAIPGTFSAAIASVCASSRPSRSRRAWSQMAM